jgi:hypothetical protein
MTTVFGSTQEEPLMNANKREFLLKEEVFEVVG